MTTCHTQASGRIDRLVHDEVARAIGHLRPRRIVIKPNWVMHETEAAYPITAMVTDARVISAAVRACATAFPEAERIVVGDCLEQRADWPLMCRQSGLDVEIDALLRSYGDRVQFLDLRKDVYREVAGRLERDTDARHGDPSGYREVQLGAESHLEPIAGDAERFSIHDHDVALTRNFHRPGDHRYLVCQTVLDADLVINLPKWKAHSKSGVTGALKNLVGINGDKSYLPHFRRGSPRWGGDEYEDTGRWLYWVQNTLHPLVKGTIAHGLLRPAWSAVKQVNNAIRRRDKQRTTPADFYAVGGSWHGNQTLWRMIYDLNFVIQRADRQGRIQTQPQRDYFCIVDGLVAGSGDGPLKATPRDTDMLVFGDDPFAIDAALSWFMGFDPLRIPVLAEREQFMGSHWGDFDLASLPITLDGVTTRVVESGLNFHFTAPPGWLGHVERREDSGARRAAS